MNKIKSAEEILYKKILADSEKQMAEHAALTIKNPSFEEMVKNPTFQMHIAAMEEYTSQFKQPDISECENKYKQLEQHFKVLEYSYNACFEELTKLKTKIEPDISEDVEKAAENYANAVYPHKEQTDSYFDNVKNYLSIGFIAGAEYQSQQPIPTVDEDKDEDEFWNKVGAILNGSVSFYMYPKYLSTLKQQFSITRK